MNFRELYASKLTTPIEAVKQVEAGDGIVFPIMPGEPPALLEAISSLDYLEGNTLYRMLPSFPILNLPKSLI